MAKQRITYRIINGIQCKCLDIGCPDLEQAAQNRQRIEEGYATEWWQWFEDSLKSTPIGEPLPGGVSFGEPFQTVGNGEKRSKRWAERKEGG